MDSLPKHEDKDKKAESAMEARLAALEKHCGLDKKAPTKDEVMRSRKRR
jgi:hypothetical protein